MTKTPANCITEEIIQTCVKYLEMDANDFAMCMVLFCMNSEGEIE